MGRFISRISLDILQLWSYNKHNNDFCHKSLHPTLQSAEKGNLTLLI